MTRQTLAVTLALACALHGASAGERPTEKPPSYRMRSVQSKTNDTTWVVVVMQATNRITEHPRQFTTVSALREFAKSLPKGTTLYYGIEGLPKTLHIGQEQIETSSLRTEFMQLDVTLRAWPGF